MRDIILIVNRFIPKLKETECSDIRFFLYEKGFKSNLFKILDSNQFQTILLIEDLNI